MKQFCIISLLLCSFICRAQTFNWNGHSVISNSVNDTVTIPVSGLPININGGFGISSVCFDIYHRSKTTLVFLLLAPDGNSVLLADGRGRVNENFIGTCFGMNGIPIDAGEPPYTGIFLPSGDISTLNNNQDPNGNWRLVIRNNGVDTGSIRFASITFQNNPPQGNGVGTGSNSGPQGPFIWPGLVCPQGASSCDLLPDMTASAAHIQSRYVEYAGRIEVSNATPNIGYGPMEIYAVDSCFCNGVPSPCNVTCPDGANLKHMLKQRIYRKRPGTDTLDYYDRNAGAMTYHPGHGHLHVDNWGSFTLRTATSDPDPRNWPIIGTSVKQSYCLVNLGTCAGYPGQCVDNNGNTVLYSPNNGFGFQTGCGLNQGIYPGNLDIYGIGLNEPILLDNVCNGNYYLVSIPDPENDFLESDENNNWAVVPITLTRQQAIPVISSSSPYLCGNGSPVILSSSTASTYHWSTGDTSRSIAITDTGTYTVTTACGVSLPFRVEYLPQGAAPAVSIAMTAGSLPACPGTAVTFTASSTYGGAAPSYQWKVNGVNAGTNSPVYTHITSSNGEKISCVLSSSIECFAATPAYSDSITVLVNPADSFETVVTQVKGYNPFCPGDTVTFKAIATPGDNPVYNWKVDGNDIGVHTQEFTSTTLHSGQSITCSINAIPLCGRNATVGISAGLNAIQTTSAAAYPTWYGNGRAQYLIQAAELSTMGLSAGALTSIGFITGSNVGNPAVLNNYTIKLAEVPQTSLTTTMLTPAFTTVFGPVNFVPILNDTNFHNFINPFVWSGTGNILIDICYTGRVTGNGSYQNLITNTFFPSGTIYQRDGNIPNACDTINGTRTIFQRPLILLANTSPKEIVSNPLLLDKMEPVYRFTGTGNWDVPANWASGKMPPRHLLHCAEIIIDPPGTEECVLNISQVIAPGARITVVTGKKFIIKGDIKIQE